MTKSTSFRLSSNTKSRLDERASRDNVTATALLERLIAEGLDQLEHPGIVFRGPVNDRRAALAGGPDVWEVLVRLRELDGSTEERIAVVSEESALHPRLIRIAVDYAADNADEIRARMDRHEAMIEQARRASEQRAALLA